MTSNLRPSNSPKNEKITVEIEAGDEEGFIATAYDSSRTAAATEEHENPFEAAWNALANVMSYLGYDEEATDA